jgi:uncharacterized membrane protein YkoI
MMNNKVKIALAVAGVTIVGLVGIGRSSFAQTAIQSPAAVLQQQKQAVELAGGDGDGETNDDAKEKQESTKLQSLAKITPQQAQQAAEAAQGGKASSVKLENENGNVVYSVVIGKTEVTVDAGNGRILSTENSQKGGKESSEQNSPKSSVQSSAGISDGEKNDDG